MILMFLADCPTCISTQVLHSATNSRILPLSMANPRPNPATRFGAKGGNPPFRDPVKAAKAAAVGSDVAMIRQRMREAAARQIGVLEGIASGKATILRPVGKDAAMLAVEPDFGDRIRAIETLSKYGVGTMSGVDLTSGGKPLTLTVEERRAELSALLGLPL